MKWAILALCLFTASSAFFWNTDSHAEDDYDPEKEPSDYGVDYSFPIHHSIKNNLNSKDPMKRFYAQRYEDHINGCYEKFTFRECDANERARFEMSLEQPAMQHNYTEMGFKKIKAPDHIYKPILEWYNMHKHKRKLEKWPRGNTYVNNWHTSTHMVSFEDRDINDGQRMKAQLWNDVKPIIEEWTGKVLKESSLYGIREYSNGSILATHVDRLPLVSSCIIQVEQDLDEAWPIEVIAHNGKAYNVTMQPGDMVLYESHTVLHGRPFPLIGRNYANVFVHYIPMDHEDEQALDEEWHKDHPNGEVAPQEQGGHEANNHRAEILAKHKLAHDKELQDSVEKKHLRAKEDGFARMGKDGQTSLHLAAARGDLNLVKKLITATTSDKKISLINAADYNNWMPIHEASRNGHVTVVKWLVEQGAKVGRSTTPQGDGTPLRWAQMSLKSDHPVVVYLKQINAPLHEE